MKPDAAVDLLGHAYETQRLATAYILSGNPRTTGQALAESLLQRLYCTSADSPCGECSACRRVRQKTHPDVLWVQPQKKSRIISIEQVRDLLGRVYLTAYEGAWKACVIVAADRLGPQASNAFLKTLEEPPGATIFLLLTDSPQFLLPTVRSRCQFIALDDGVEALDDWDQQLVEILSMPGDTAAEIGILTSGLARGNRVAALFKMMKDAAQTEVNEEASSESVDEDTDTLNARGSSRYREMRTRLMRTMLLWYRDHLLLVCGGDESGLNFTASLDIIRTRASALTSRQALRHVRVIEEMHDRMERNLPEATVLGDGFGKLGA